jgi:hypothetical protein
VWYHLELRTAKFETSNQLEKGSLPVPGEQKSAADKIIEFFGMLQINEPVAIKEISKATGLSWPAIKKVLQSGTTSIHFRKSENTWIAWKSTDRVGYKSGDTCAKLLRETPLNKE